MSEDKSNSGENTDTESKAADSGAETESAVKAEKKQGFLSKAWDKYAPNGLKTTVKVVDVITKPVQWAVKGTYAVNKGIYSANKPLGIAFGAAVAGATLYGSALGIVISGDQTSFLNWPATQGDWSGKVTRFSEKGTWPCNSYEGNIRTGEAADSELFAVRKWDTEIVQALQNRPQDAPVTIVYHDNIFSQGAFGEVHRNKDGEFQSVDSTLFLGCIQHSDHTAVGVHYTVPETGAKVSVGLKPNQ